MVYYAIPIGKGGTYMTVSKASLGVIGNYTLVLRGRSINNKMYRYVYGYKREKGKSATVPRVGIHRVILGIEDSKCFVDHANGDSLDNRIENIRACTHAENMRNRKLQKNKTGFPGVTLTEHGGYRACVITNGIKTRKTFRTGEEAHLFYIETKKRLHGKFAGYQNK